MNAFWIIVAALVLGVLALLLPSLLRPRPTTRDLTQNLVLRDIRIAELQRDVDDRVMDAADLAGAEDEVARALLEESDPGAVTSDARAVRSGHWLLPAFIFCLIPAISLFTYLTLGSPQLATGLAEADPAAASTIDQKTIDAMVVQLEQRLQDDPESAEGWLLLGRTYMALGRYDDAVPALARAHELVGDLPQVLLQYADALAMADGGRIDADVLALVNRALALEPENLTALWLAGLGAGEAGDTEKALSYLRQAQTLGARDGTPTVEIDAAIRELEARAPAAQQSMAPAAVAAVAVTINIDPTLRSRVDAEDVLFVFARAPGQNGPPLAVSKSQADNLPREIVLDDTMSMAPMFKLKIGDTVTVTARISKSGTPEAQSGDLHVSSEPFVIGERNAIALLIDKVVE